MLCPPHLEDHLQRLADLGKQGGAQHALELGGRHLRGGWGGAASISLLFPFLGTASGGIKASARIRRRGFALAQWRARGAGACTQERRVRAARGSWGAWLRTGSAQASRLCSSEAQSAPAG